MLSKIKFILPIALALFLPVLNLFSNSEEFNVSSLDFLIKWLCASCVLYLLWYVLFFVSAVKSRYRYLFTALSISVFIVAIYLIFTLVLFKAPHHVKWMFIVKLSSASILFLIIQYALRTSKEISRLTLEKEQMQSEQYRVQLQELRQKVDPHFLFNSMNTLRMMIRNQHPQSEEFVMNLSSFYRQTLKFNNASVVNLQEEIDVLKAYLFLMQIRNEGKVEVDINIDSRWTNYEIPTLSLQIVAENCFKHNQALASHPLKIVIRSVDDFYISVLNNMQPKFYKDETSGYGLDNIRKRYELLGVKQGVIIHQTDDYFEVKLKLI